MEYFFGTIKLNTSDNGSFHTPSAIFYNKTKRGEVDKIIGQTFNEFGELKFLQYNGVMTVYKAV